MSAATFLPFILRSGDISVVVPTHSIPVFFSIAFFHASRDTCVISAVSCFDSFGGTLHFETSVFFEGRTLPFLLFSLFGGGTLVFLAL